MIVAPPINVYYVGFDSTKIKREKSLCNSRTEKKSKKIVLFVMMLIINNKKIIINE